MVPSAIDSPIWGITTSVAMCSLRTRFSDAIEGAQFSTPAPHWGSIVATVRCRFGVLGERWTPDLAQALGDAFDLPENPQ